MDVFSSDGVHDEQSRVPVIQSAVRQDRAGQGSEPRASRWSVV